MLVLLTHMLQHLMVRGRCANVNGRLDVKLLNDDCTVVGTNRSCQRHASESLELGLGRGADTTFQYPDRRIGDPLL